MIKTIRNNVQTCLRQSIFLTCLFTSCLSFSFDKQLTIATMPASGQERKAFNEFLLTFKRVSLINVSVKAYAHEYYKENIEHILSTNPDNVDLFFWFGGHRLYQLAHQNLIQPFDPSVFNSKQISRFNQTFMSEVTFKNKVYALPLNYYNWGIYYRRSLFQELNLAPMDSFEALKHNCELAHQQNVSLFLESSNTPWTLAGWFDYLDLRINGLEFHKALLKGNIPFTHPKVTLVFNEWKALIDRHCFLKNDQPTSWKQSLPQLYRNKAAAILMGSFFLPLVPQSIQQDLGFFPFPKYKNKPHTFENAPLDVIVMSNTASKEAVQKFIDFISVTSSLYQLNARLNKQTPFQTQMPHADPLTNAGHNLLQQTTGISQFFDRDSPSSFSKPAMQLFKEFVYQKKGVEQTQKELETLRQKTLLENSFLHKH